MLQMRPIVHEIVSDITSILLDKEKEVEILDICCLLSQGAFAYSRITPALERQP
jgi:hypothetical protein